MRATLSPAPFRLLAPTPSLQAFSSLIEEAAIRCPLVSLVKRYGESASLTAHGKSNSVTGAKMAGILKPTNLRIPVAFILAAAVITAALAAERVGQDQRLELQTSDVSALASFDEFIESTLARWEVPGIAIAIVKNGAVTYSKGFGLRDVKRGLPVTPDTLFAIASCTKAFTAFAIGTLVDEGKIDWNKSVETYLPGFQLFDASATRDLTTIDLLSHRTGLPLHDLLTYNNQTLSRSEVVARLRYVEPSSQLRERFQYSNLNYVIAGYLTETLVGESWEGIVRKRVLDPLDMRRSNLSVSESQGDPDFAKPYRKVKDALLEIPFARISIGAPAGGINSSVNEMTRWMMVNLHQGQYESRQLIQPATLRQIQTPQMIIAALPTDQDGSVVSYAMGWLVSSHRGRLLLQHSGGASGFSAMVSLFPLEQVGIVVLTNAESSDLPKIVTLQAADRLFDNSSRDWSGEALARRQLERAHGRQAESSRKRGPRPSHELVAYVGQYEHPGYGVIKIEEKGNKLQAVYNTTDVRQEKWRRVLLEHLHYDVFEAADSAPPMPPKMKHSFQMDVDGNIDSLTVPLEPSVRPIVFTKRVSK